MVKILLAALPSVPSALKILCSQPPDLGKKVRSPKKSQILC
jgi:hypothetical protein